MGVGELVRFALRRREWNLSSAAMKIITRIFSAVARAGLLASVFTFVACNGDSQNPEPVESETAVEATLEEPSLDGMPADVIGMDAPAHEAQITELRNTIESGREHIEHLEAFVEMERAKVEENPDYDTSFLEEALSDQENFRNAIEASEKSLQELTRPRE